MEEILKEHGSGILAVISSLFFLSFFVGTYRTGGIIREVVTDFFLGACG